MVKNNQKIHVWDADIWNNTYEHNTYRHMNNIMKTGKEYGPRIFLCSILFEVTCGYGKMLMVVEYPKNRI